MLCCLEPLLRGRSQRSSARPVKRATSSSSPDGLVTRARAKKTKTEPSFSKAMASKKSETSWTVHDPGSPRFSFADGQIPGHANVTQSKKNQSRALRRANTALRLARDAGQFLVSPYSLFIHMFSF